MTKKATKAKAPAKAPREGVANDKAAVVGSPLPETEKVPDNEVRGTVIPHAFIPVDATAEGRDGDKSPVTDAPNKPDRLNHHADETGTPIKPSKEEVQAVKAAEAKPAKAKEGETSDDWASRYFENVAANERVGQAK